MNDTMKKLMENTYWILPNRFLAGEYPRTLDENTSRKKIDMLIHAGVSRFIDLTHERDGLLPYSHMLTQAVHERFPIRDVSVPETPEFTKSILDTIDHHLEEGKCVYLHCWGGIGRTGVIVGCWLSRHGYSGDAALIRLRELWSTCAKSRFRSSPETEIQEKYIRNWNEYSKKE